MVKFKAQKKKKKKAFRDIACEVGEKLLLRFREVITEFLKNRARPIQWQLAEGWSQNLNVLRAELEVRVCESQPKDL